MNHPQDKGWDQRAIRLIKDIATTTDGPMQRARLSHALKAHSPEDVICLLEAIYLKAIAGHSGARALLITLSDWDEWVPHLGLERLEAWRAEAKKKESLVYILLLSLPPKQKLVIKHVDELNEKMEDVPLGHRKALARRRERRVIERIRMDNHPDVLRILLRNPRLTEGDVLFMASRKPISKGALTAIAQAPKWHQRPTIRLALANNPYAAPELVAGLLPTLTVSDLKTLVQNTKLHADIRGQARTLLQARKIEMRTYREASRVGQARHYANQALESDESDLAKALIEATLHELPKSDRAPITPVVKRRRPHALRSRGLAQTYLNTLGDAYLQAEIPEITLREDGDDRAPLPIPQDEPPVDAEDAERIAAEFLENMGPIVLVPVSESGDPSEVDAPSPEKNEADGPPIWDMEAELSAEEFMAGLGELTLTPVQED